jgi:drug/metabolite transporter (DMT)-like permease
MILAGLFFGGRFKVTSFPAFSVVIYLALLSACAYTIWGILLKYNDVSSVSVFGFMTPVFGFVLSSIILKEHLSQQLWLTIIALVLVCLGILCVNLNIDKLKKHKNIEKEKN